MQQELIEMLEEIIPYVEVWHKEDQDVLDKAEALVEKAKNNARDVPVYQLAKLGGPTETAWIDVTQEVYEDAGFYKDDFKRRILSTTPAPAPAQYKDSTPQLSVGESSFESWFESYNPANKGDKQRARDAYAAGMGDPLVTVTPAQEFNKSVADAEIKAMYTESQGSDKGWLGIEGSYFIGGVVAARRQKKATKPAQDEPFGCFRAEPFGWTDCAEDDEGAIALYERPQDAGLTDEEICECFGIDGADDWVFKGARAIIEALRAKDN